MKPHLIMPMGGAGSRFKKDGIEKPKPLIEINERPFLYWSTASIIDHIGVQDITFVVLKKHVVEYSIDKVIKRQFQEYPTKIVVIDDVLPGPVFTAMKGVEDITDNAPVIINDCDHMFRCAKVEDILNLGIFDVDGGLLIFESSEPQFSYVKYDIKGNITGTIEKKAISNHAICGAYIFRNAGIFKEMSEMYIQHCPHKECFMSGIYSEMCSNGMEVKDYLLDYHVEFGTPEEYEKAKMSPYFIK